MVDLTVIGNTAGQGIALPAIIARAKKGARTRFLEFFTVNIRNLNTRAAYGRAAVEFLQWCERQGMNGLDEVESVHVATYKIISSSPSTYLSERDRPLFPPVPGSFVSIRSGGKLSETATSLFLSKRKIWNRTNGQEEWLYVSR